jgi:hypothetical protein
MSIKSARWVFSSVICFISLIAFANAGQLVYSTYIGGSDDDPCLSMAIDSAGNVYITGWTKSSTDFPTTAGSFDTIYNGGITDAYVCKLNSEGTSLDYSILLGGNNYDAGYGITVDNAGNAFVLGVTSSPDFPVTTGAYNTTSRGVFIVKINSTGSGLLYSTFLGSGTASKGIAVDNNGNAYVAGYTTSSTFPTTPGAFDTTYNGGYYDVFVSKLSASGSALIYSTYLGGIVDDVASYLAIDSSGNAYIVGYTNSTTGFPTTAGAYDTTLNNKWNYNDAFVSKLNASGSALIYSTFLGGSDDDQGFRIVVNSAGNAYITGYTHSSTFPTTPGAFDTTFNSTNAKEAFLTKLKADGSGLIFSSLLGGSSDDKGSGVTLDSFGNIYVTGQTMSSDFPITPNAMDSSFGGADIFITKFDPTGSTLLYSTYFSSGASLGIFLDTAGYLYIAGVPSSTDFLTTPGAFDTTYNGGNFDAFAAKFSFPRPTEIEQELWKLYQVP